MGLFTSLVCQKDTYVDSSGSLVATSGDIDKLPFNDWIYQDFLNMDFSPEEADEFLHSWYECECGDCYTTENLQPLGYSVGNSVCAGTHGIQSYVNLYEDEFEYVNTMQSSDESAVTLKKGKCQEEYNNGKIALGLIVVLGAAYFLRTKI
tara:strand:+ start:151 stop:600 length:450 start_codon:yes stop_codon:yes gene_type:complete